MEEGSGARQHPVNFPFFPHMEIPVCPSIAGRISALHLHGSLCACEHPPTSSLCFLSQEPVPAALLCRAALSPLSSFPSQEESLGLYVQGVPSLTGGCESPAHCLQLGLSSIAHLGQLTVCLRGPLLSFLPFPVMTLPLCSRVSPSSTSSINHLHEDPYFRVCFWEALPETCK